MKNILRLTIISLGFTACNTTGGTQESIAVTINCNTNKDTTNYQILQSGDTISKQETLYDNNNTDPKVEIFHTQDGIKKICINSGTAIILR